MNKAVPRNEHRIDNMNAQLYCLSVQLSYDIIYSVGRMKVT